MQNKIQDGRVIDYSPQAAIAGGDLVTFDAFVAVAATDIAPGDAVGALVTEGVFALPKATGAITRGAPLYVDSDKKLTATAGTLYAGVAWEAAAANATTVACRINFGSPKPEEKAS